jgi:hypothetical protein
MSGTFAQEYLVTGRTPNRATGGTSPLKRLDEAEAFSA